MYPYVEGKMRATDEKRRRFVAALDPNVERYRADPAGPAPLNPDPVSDLCCCFSPRHQTRFREPSIC